MTYFRFGTRDLLWAMALLAIGLAWWLDHSQLQAKSVRYLNALVALRTIGLDVPGLLNRPELSEEVEAAYRARKR